jgi:adenylylsulfate kinase-like enzyme
MKIIRDLPFDLDDRFERYRTAGIVAAYCLIAAGLMVAYFISQTH